MYIEMQGIGGCVVREKEEKIQVTTGNSYIKEVVKGIKNKNYKSLVCQELECHLYDRIDYYKELGYDEDTAKEKATEDMGDPDETAIPLNTLHSQKWYRQPATVIVLALLIIQFLLLSVFSDFSYLSGAREVPTIYGSMFSIQYFQFGEFHYITKDIISMLILYFNVFVVFLGWKKQNKIIMIAETITIFFHLYFAPYQPAFYGITRIILNGYYSYIYGMYDNNVILDGGVYDCFFEVITLLTILMTLLMLICCIVFTVNIARKERGKLKRQNVRNSKILKGILTVVIAVHFIVVSVSMVIAGLYLETKKEKEAEFRKEIIDCILEKGKSVKEVVRDIEEITGKKYKGEIDETNTEDSTDVAVSPIIFYLDNIQINVKENCYSDRWSPEEYGVEYILPYFYCAGVFAEEPLLYRDLDCTESEFNTVYEGMTFQQFRETGLIYKAVAFDTDILGYNYDVVELRKEDGTRKSFHFFNDKYVEYDGDYDDKKFEELLRSAEYEYKSK